MILAVLSFFQYSESIEWMKNQIITNLVSVLFLLLIGVSACKKDPSSDKIIYGTLSLEIQVKHHSWNVPNIPLYLKKNASQYPGPDTSLYELRTVADSDGKAIFEQLYPGKYYLFAEGYDYYYGAPVIGSIPLSLTNPASQNEPVQVTLMVSE